MSKPFGKLCTTKRNPDLQALDQERGEDRKAYVRISMGLHKGIGIVLNGMINRLLAIADPEALKLARRFHPGQAFLTAVGSGVPPTTLITKAGQFAGHVTGSDSRYIPYPANWLREKRWTDDYDSIQNNPYAEEDAHYPPCPPGIAPDVWRGIRRGLRDAQRQKQLLN